MNRYSEPTVEAPMMNPFTTHPYRQGITYLEHSFFAMGIASRLLVSAIAFVVHAMLPFVHINPQHDLEATAAFLTEQNRWIETAKATDRIGTRAEAVVGPF
jgi:hypothetical protein